MGAAARGAGSGERRRICGGGAGGPAGARGAAARPPGGPPLPGRRAAGGGRAAPTRAAGPPPVRAHPSRWPSACPGMPGLPNKCAGTCAALRGASCMRRATHWVGRQVGQRTRGSAGLPAPPLPPAGRALHKLLPCNGNSRGVGVEQQHKHQPVIGGRLAASGAGGRCCRRRWSSRSSARRLHSQALAALRPRLRPAPLRQPPRRPAARGRT